jgi:uncharacterized protein (TIGR03437 family)
LNILADPTGLTSGTYNGTVTVQASNSALPSATILVTLTVALGTATPSITAVTNAASFLPGPVAPGELITIFGGSLGPGTLAPADVNSQGVIEPTLAATRVLFDGNAAPVIYTSAGQVAAIVPYAVASDASAMLQVEYQGVLSSAVNLAVNATSPAMFTLDNTGQGAIINQDGSINSTTSGAQPGSVVSVYATGAGQVTPPALDGTLAKASSLSKPVLPVTVKISGENAEVLYAGDAPGLASGMLQVNVQVPPDAPHGQQVPVVLLVGGNTSPTAYMWIK